MSKISLILRKSLDSSRSETLYPKIPSHITEVVQNLQELHRDPDNANQEIALEPIPLIGTVRLHGTHADILIHSDDRIQLQSRNKVGLQTTKDNAGFAATMSKKTKALLRLRDLLKARYTHLHPNIPIDPIHPVLIAGEWIGHGVQKDVAISQLSKRFVIISLCIDGTWQKDSDYGGISLPNHGIYNIARARPFMSTLYPSDPDHTAAQLSILTEAVASQCPFAATFGITGPGEGIIWKPACAPYNSNPKLWFTTTGGAFASRSTHLPKLPQHSSHAREIAAEAARVWCDERRMQQGLEYLEKSGETGVKGLGTFLKWVQKDILEGEGCAIKEREIKVGELKIEIGKIARGWYAARGE